MEAYHPLSLPVSERDPEQDVLGGDTLITKEQEEMPGVITANFREAIDSRTTGQYGTHAKRTIYTNKTVTGTVGIKVGAITTIAQLLGVDLATDAELSRLLNVVIGDIEKIYLGPDRTSITAIQIARNVRIAGKTEDQNFDSEAVWTYEASADELVEFVGSLEIDKATVATDGVVHTSGPDDGFTVFTLIQTPLRLSTYRRNPYLISVKDEDGVDYDTALFTVTPGTKEAKILTADMLGTSETLYFKYVYTPA